MFKYLLFLISIIFKEISLYQSTDENHNFYSYDLIKSSITKFSPERIYNESEKNKIYQFDVEIILPAREGKFHLLMYEDVAFRESFLLSNGSDARFYEGIVKGNPSSSVLGFIHNGVFSGSIKTSNGTYFVEPAHSVLDNIEDSQLSILYSNYDIKYPVNICKDTYTNLEFIDMKAEDFYNEDLFKIKSGITCLIEMVSDHTLYEHLDKDENKVRAYLYFHSKFTDYIFRNTDFNGDGRADNVRVVQTAAYIYKSSSDSNYPMVASTNIDDFLKAFSKRMNSYCLAVSLFYRLYSGETIGLSYTPSVTHNSGRVKMTKAGICEPIHNPHSYNIAVVNTQKFNGQPYPLGVTLLSVAHEIGHSFGSPHDPVEVSDCTPTGSHGYIMDPYEYDTKYPWQEKFSSCSAKQIFHILVHKSNCMNVMPPVCGNAIRDPGEECDCGGEQKLCDALDPCCTPADVAPPEKGCTVRSNKGYVCSAKEEQCCDDTCHVASKKPCLFMLNECYPNECDGKVAACPNPRKRSKKEACVGVHRFCPDGFCENTICRKVGYSNCICNNPLMKECLVCCLINGECKPASVIGLRTLDGTGFLFPKGAPCNYSDKNLLPVSGRFICTDEGYCVSRSSILKTGALYWFITFIILLWRRLLSVS